MRANAVQPAGVVAVAADIALVGDVAERVIRIAADGVDRAAGGGGAGNTVERVIPVSFDQVVVGIQPSEFLKSGVT
jgi:hypothetical protein